MIATGTWRRPTREAWFRERKNELWTAREMFSDPLSKMLFDECLVLRLTNHSHFFFPKQHFLDTLFINSDKDFCVPDMPSELLGMRLRELSVEVRLPFHENKHVNVVTCKETTAIHNSYRQYFIEREGCKLYPQAAETVFDCGACIGDTAAIMAAIVGASGCVHLFEPDALHITLCKYQAKINPILSDAFVVVNKAVGNCSRSVDANLVASSKVDPGRPADYQVSSISLDDYVEKAKLHRVDYIKMDIEGAEQVAIHGAESTIRKFRPKLAVAVYHNDDDLWQIPMLIKTVLPQYRLFFDHHSPYEWESFVYACV